MENARILEENLSLIDDTAGGNSLRPGIVNGSASAVIILRSKSGHPVPKVLAESGKWLTLHSTVNPVEEAKQFATAINCKSNTIIVILGVGLGYHVEQILRKTQQQPVIFVEKEPYLLKEFLSAKKLKKYLDEKDIYFLTSQHWEDILLQISQIQMKHNYLPFSVIQHIPSIRAFHDFYSNVKNRLEASAAIDIGAKLRYPKFRSEETAILIIHSKYYLLGEIINSLKKMGHRTRVVMVEAESDREGSQDVIENIISEIISFRPDFILTVNHLGFDRGGILTGFFTDIEMPYASWYVDSPVFILEDYKKQISPFLSIFVWDSDYIPDLLERGFEHVCFLPLATDPDIFKKTPPEKNPLRHLECDVGFVGNSGEKIIRECIEKFQDVKISDLLLDKIANQYHTSKERYLHEVDLCLNDEEKKSYECVMQNMRDIFEPAVTWKATQMYRMKCVEKLLKFQPHIHGDPGWHRFIDGKAVLKPELNYYDELPFFYNVCKINFNTTSLQMKNGINQRVFDVPACGSFLLTDYRDQISDMFTVGQEVICYSDPDEIEDLVSFYLQHPSQRTGILRKAYERVMKEHTYVIRLKNLLAQMKKLYG